MGGYEELSRSPCCRLGRANLGAQKCANTWHFDAVAPQSLCTFATRRCRWQPLAGPGFGGPQLAERADKDGPPICWRAPPQHTQRYVRTAAEMRAWAGAAGIEDPVTCEGQTSWGDFFLKVCKSKLDAHIPIADSTRTSRAMLPNLYSLLHE